MARLTYEKVHLYNKAITQVTKKSGDSQNFFLTAIWLGSFRTPFNHLLVYLICLVFDSKDFLLSLKSKF